MQANLILLPGDGIGPEIVREATACLEAVASAFGHAFRFDSQLLGGAALRRGLPALPEATLAACRSADAVLLGAVGDPAFEHLALDQRPEGGLLKLRQELGLFANLRPAAVSEGRIQASPLRPERVRGTDLMIVRELAGGLYFGQPRWRQPDRALNTLVYSSAEVERVARVAFELAGKRRGRLTSVDKANVLETSQLWRAEVNRLAAQYPGVAVDHLYVDACAMALVTRPSSFDVILTENLFGDILSDEAAVLTGSLGMLPSASLGDGVALYEPIHGSAPDLAGQGIANPVGTILSAAMLLRYSLDLEAEAAALEAAVAGALDAGYGTPDLAGTARPCDTAGLGEAIRERLGATVAGR